MAILAALAAFLFVVAGNLATATLFPWYISIPLAFPLGWLAARLFLWMIDY